ncbi:MAG: D-alanyl-D-alanine carboxypeptidase family protein [Clostridia bacterium]|nr:D-alanyl-D-alanine carboxypeptidase family protein [Clostridia bacterium]
MNYRPDDDAHFVAKKRQYIKRKRKTRTFLIAAFCIAIAVVWVMIIFTVKRLTDAYSPAETTYQTTEAVETTAPPVIQTDSGSFYTDAETETLEISREAINKGSLMLVSDYLGHAAPEKAPTLTTVWGNKSPTYYVASATLGLVNEAFRAADKMFSDYCEEYSNSDYQITMAYSDGSICCAEHATGYAFDVNVYKKDGTSMRLAEAAAEEEMYAWLYENAAKYGFVLRYAADKTGVTGMSHDPDHFRYVGEGHSRYMSENNLALEEYIGTVQKYSYEGEHLLFEYDGASYEVFYVKMPDDAESVAIDIPADVSYTLSGDNISGAIVTLYK